MLCQNSYDITEAISWSCVRKEEQKIRKNLSTNGWCLLQKPKLTLRE